MENMILLIKYDVEYCSHICLNSVLNQTYQRFEIICVVDIN